MMRTRTESGRSPEGAFSLIEVLVAVTLLAVITIGLLAMFYQTQKAFRIGTSQVDVLENGRATMQLLCRDLQQMHTSNMSDVTNFLAEPTGTPWIVMNLPGGGQRRNVFQDVSFLTKEGGSWSGISYRVNHTDKGVGTLYRAVLSTNVAGIMTQSGGTAQKLRETVENMSAVIGQRFLSGQTPANPPAAAKSFPQLVFDRVADGVVHFRVFAYTETGVLYTNNAYVSGNGDVYHMRNFVPAYLDVELAILDPKAMKQVDRRNAAEARNYLEDQAYRTHVFRQRVNLRARQLEHDLFAAK